MLHYVVKRYYSIAQDFIFDAGFTNQKNNITQYTYLQLVMLIGSEIQGVKSLYINHSLRDSQCHEDKLLSKSYRGKNSIHFLLYFTYSGIERHMVLTHEEAVNNITVND